MKTRYNDISQYPFNISHSFSCVIRLTQSRYWREYCLEDPRTGVRFCYRVGDVA